MCIRVFVGHEAPEPLPPDMPCVLSPTVPEVTPANVSGGGGSKSELVITWEVSESQNRGDVHQSRRWNYFPL